jgi:RPA family protein
LDHDTVKAIFRIARFQMMDQKQLGRLRANSVQNVEEAALDEWTNTFMKREDEIRAARNCKSN